MRSFRGRQPPLDRFGLPVVGVAVDMLEHVDRGQHELGAEASRQPRQHARAPIGTLRRDLRADPVEIFPPELGMGVFDRGELAKDRAGLRIGFGIGEGG
jgi:hypothetical protein